MPAILTRLLRDLLHQPQEAGADGWLCLKLDDALAADPRRLGRVRELVVDRPEALTLPVLAAACRLTAVALRGRWWLPPEIVAELNRRDIAVVRGLAGSRFGDGRRRSASP